MKINLTKIIEFAERSGEGANIVEKQSNAWNFVKIADPITVGNMAREILRLREALEKVESHGCCVMHNDERCPGCTARQALEKSREVFE